MTRTKLWFMRLIIRNRREKNHRTRSKNVHGAEAFDGGLVAGSRHNIMSTVTKWSESITRNRNVVFQSSLISWSVKLHSSRALSRAESPAASCLIHYLLFAVDICRLRRHRQVRDLHGRSSCPSLVCLRRVSLTRRLMTRLLTTERALTKIYDDSGADRRCAR